MATMQTTHPKSTESHASAPRKGDKYRCRKCGMAMEITVDCKCRGDDHAHFECCGEEMELVS